MSTDGTAARPPQAPQPTEVRIDRLVLRDVSLAHGEAARLGRLISAELGQDRKTSDPRAAVAPTAHSIAAAVANRIRAELRTLDR